MLHGGSALTGHKTDMSGLTAPFIQLAHTPTLVW